MLREGLRQVVPRPAVFRALARVGLVLRPFTGTGREQNCLLKHGRLNRVTTAP
ncbi:hypothetical protein ACNKHN_17075 [Shigella flexneri]